MNKITFKDIKKRFIDNYVFYDYDLYVHIDRAISRIDFINENCILFNKLFDKYNDYEFENADKFIYDILKNDLNDYLKDKSKKLNKHFKDIDDLYKRNKDLIVIFEEWNKPDNKINEFIKLYEFMKLIKVIASEDKRRVFEIEGVNIRSHIIKNLCA